jgi:uracil phosphoribosyltransferase
LIPETVTELKSHPLISRNLAILRDKHSSNSIFRDAVKKLSYFLFYESSRALKTTSISVETPLIETTGIQFNQHIWLCPICRAGLGMLEPGLDLFPDASVGMIGLYRDEETFEPQFYYEKLPASFSETDFCFLIDPMLATGGSIDASLALMIKRGAKNITLLTLISAPEGLKLLTHKYPDVRIVTTSIDERLNNNNYILPGLGDAGDRFFNT